MTPIGEGLNDKNNTSELIRVVKERTFHFHFSYCIVIRESVGASGVETMNTVNPWKLQMGFFRVSPEVVEQLDRSIKDTYDIQVDKKR